MIVIGLTGSIGMGKSVAASMISTLGVPVFEADAEVHELLSPGGKALAAIGAAFPYFEFSQIYGKKDKSGARIIKRDELGKIVFKDEARRERLESIMHPLVREGQNEFIRKHRGLGAEMVVLDIPLLFETGGDEYVDYTIVVTAPYDIQRQRVLERPGMDEKKFAAILERQMPDGEKRALADYIVHTGLGRAHTMKELKDALADIRKKQK